MKAVIMAGGLGSRLRPLTDRCPKPMVSFANRPVLDHILNLLKRHHILEVVITVHHLADHIQRYLGDGSHRGMTIHYAVENFPLGSAGGIKNAQQYLDDETFLVISGDAITDVDLSSVLAFHREKQALVTLVLKHIPDPREFGVVVVNESGRIRRFREKPGGKQITSDIVNTGIYFVEPEVLALMEPGRAYDFSLDIFPLILRQNALFGYLTDSYWSDIGTIRGYLKATADAIAGKINLSPAVDSRQSPHVYNHTFQNNKMKARLLAMMLLKDQRYYPLYWIVLSLLVLAADYAMGPYIQFPFLFIIPVALATWYNGRRWGLVLAVGLPLARLYFTTLWVLPWTTWEAGINAVIRISVLVMFAVLIDRTAQQTRGLAEEVRILSGILPICGFCKKIRNDDDGWEPVEEYVTKHSEALFSHGMCPSCAKEHYGEFFKD